MPQLVQIIRKGNEHLAQDGDEIELDIEALDTETLWELDRFVTNWSLKNTRMRMWTLMRISATHFPPVEIEKDKGGGEVGHDQDRDYGNASSGLSSSSSSSSSFSSSSDSDSGSSSGSDSDADDVQS
ncbi:unnamed protein product [Fraxinus pennsylvanica]|uniref:NET domain-containing protein n=1 Tax=Fraxinus pennsylvanica TaxID=56036 RepID=A0AAD1ZG17_9LAMI|nr:unnamed protein product [Fraxinus pennsylvanica]